MKKLLATLAVIAIASPSFAGDLLDSHGNPVGTKDAKAVATSVQDAFAPQAAPEAAPAAATKTTVKKQYKKNKVKKSKKHSYKGKKMSATAPASAAPVVEFGRRGVEKR
jgi:hypothetical protein